MFEAGTRGFDGASNCRGVGRRGHDRRCDTAASGRLEESVAIAARQMALAQQIVRDYPDSAHAYRALSEAYNHIKKNAIRSSDKRLEEEALVQAVEAARRAMALDPDQLETRCHLDELTEQLASIRCRPGRRWVSRLIEQMGCHCPFFEIAATHSPENDDLGTSLDCPTPAVRIGPGGSHAATVIILSASGKRAFMG